MATQTDWFEQVTEYLQTIRDAVSTLPDWTINPASWSIGDNEGTVLLEKHDNRVRLKITRSLPSDRFTVRLDLRGGPLISLIAKNRSLDNKLATRGWLDEWDTTDDDSYLAGISLTREGPKLNKVIVTVLSEYEQTAQTMAKLAQLYREAEKIIDEM